MTDTQEHALPAATTGDQDRSAKRRGSLSTMLLPELQQLAGSLGLATAKQKKSDLVAAIQAAQSPAASAQTTQSAAATQPAAAGAARAGRTSQRTRATRGVTTTAGVDTAPTSPNGSASGVEAERVWRIDRCQEAVGNQP